jgi:hypothetical protein
LTETEAAREQLQLRPVISFVKSCLYALYVFHHTHFRISVFMVVSLSASFCCYHPLSCILPEFTLIRKLALDVGNGDGSSFKHNTVKALITLAMWQTSSRNTPWQPCSSFGD